MRYLYLLLTISCFYSCKDRRDDITQLVNKWEDKEIVFPAHSIFTVQGRDTVSFSFSDANYKIVSYIDSVGCTGCKLHLPRWRRFMYEVDTLMNASVPFVFYFHPKNIEDLRYIIRRDTFTHPVCLDVSDKFNILNHFPSERAFQTFLLNKKNKIIAIGNPILNPKVKELYLKILAGNISKTTTTSMTEVAIDNLKLDFGSFMHSEIQERSFVLTNIGEAPLIVQDITTSCGCMKTRYVKKPIPPGEKLEITVIYEAEQAEYFNKTIAIHCNIKSSPIILRIVGNSE
ncbi:DUF1573 domain-containing protein [Bacteroides intestinalis]|uniref:DUF1573 domain-containing protein n=1 Tax=Bacteroides intestinalis TaxID=329854 RepID=A0A412Y151_9BACE|nr:DUF1573 domain-containing protein [Bacteroides intestinalis]RGV51252.1 DUF1573 domain-containing protein [Bacteroides intestinalis]RHA62674.1 DUF1573 domain-containing protein [Bacteroides intestinalis]